MVFYRKYRPQKISDLDSAAVRELLLSIFGKKNLSDSSVPHAFLFTGPKGLGKTSTARIVAKTVNCERLDTLSSDIPCNRCDQCLAITNGTSLDILEIDAASNRGIDEIRDLKEKITLSPVSAAKKVYIIDEVHMLTTEAFNALLKTLEEPPDHAIFILCTTEPHKVLATIISRCFHIHFNLATEDEIVHSLKRIVDGEKLKIDDAALQTIASMADGGFRDAAKILEEVSLISQDQKITKEFVEEKYKVLSITYQVSEMFATLVKRDIKQGLEVIQKITQQGIDLKYFLQSLMNELHRMLLVEAGITSKEVVSKSSTQVQGKHEVSIAEIRELFGLFSKAYVDMKFAVLPQLPLELAVIEWGTKTSVREVQGNTVVEVAMTNGVTVSHLRKQVGEMQKNKALYGEPKVVKEDKQKIQTTSVELLKTPANGEITKEWQDALWQNIILEMKNYNHTVAGVLRSCMIKKYSKEEIVIETAYKFHKERLEDAKTREALSKICKMLTGNTIKIGVELKR